MVCVSLFSYQGSLPFSSDSFDSLSYSKPFVKNFLGFFQIHFCDIRNESSDSFQTEKEGFEPSRRANDLHP